MLNFSALTAVRTFPALLGSSSPTSTLNRNTFSAQWHCQGGSGFAEWILLVAGRRRKALTAILSPSQFLSIHGFCNCWLCWSQGAAENRRQLSSQGFWSKKGGYSWELTGWLLVKRVRQGQTSAFQPLHWTVAYLNTWLTSLLLRGRYLSSFKIKALSGFVDLPDCI